MEDDKLDILLERMQSRKRMEENIKQLIEEATGNKFRIVNKEAIRGLMEEVSGIESKEEKNKVIRDFFEDIYHGKITDKQ